ncbi:MAG TPA: pyridoxal-dependent decarboxylase [Thermodesulfobacteriota bacterium]|nr:pyridoxal-dependent decarboxylase [Thermodesulfobacteriota bacterium]
MHRIGAVNGEGRAEDEPPGARPAAAELEELYGAHALRRLGHALVDQLADFLEAVQRGEGPVLPWRPPAERVASWGAPPPGRTADPLAAVGPLVARILDESLRVHHPRYIGHQVSVAPPVAALADLIGSLLGNETCIYELGPAGTAIEMAVLDWCLAAVGWPAGADGLITSGGSLGNLTALLAARAAAAPGVAWREGVAAAPRLALLASEHVHYCVTKAAGIIGLGEGAVVPVATDGACRMDPAALRAAYRRALRAGRRVMAVVASAGVTATGAYDPLRPIGEFCRERGLWLHVDGAHGASALLSPRHRAKLDGLALADSLVWDFHKLLFMPAMASVVLFRDGRRAHTVFEQDASYLYHAEAADVRYDLGHRTFECTKRVLALPLWLTLMTYGVERLVAPLERTYELARWLAERLAREPDIEVPHEPESNIVCFRLRHPFREGAELDAFQEAVRRRLARSGSFYLSQARLPSGLHLRATLMNALTTEEELDALPTALRAAAAEVEQG